MTHGHRVGRAVGAIAILAAALAEGQVVPAPIFTDGMVLQRESTAPIWGWAPPRERIAVHGSWGRVQVGKVTGDDGRWRIDLPTPEAGGPYTVTIEAIDRSESVVLEDVMIGEVWLCSGQSNMEMPLANIRPGYTGVDDWESEVEGANWPEIRLLTVPNTVSLHPVSDLEMSWSACTPETARVFSATGYFFARELHRELGVPVGVISADWGGTRIEAWMSPEALRAFDAYADGLDHLERLSDPNRRLDIIREAAEGWWDRLDAKAPGGASWKTGGGEASAWRAVELPSTLSGDLESFDGIVYLRRTIDLDEEWDGRAATLSLGPIDDMDDTWVNGVHVGSVHESGRWNEARRYEIPRGVLVEGENTIAIRVYDTSGPGGVFGEPEQLAIESGGRAVALAGEWSLAKGPGANELPARVPTQVGPNTLTALYHGMIEAVAPYGIRGATWYQGESNRGNASMYDELMRAMIGDWRDRWGRGDFPFYYVQIAPFDYGGETGQTPALREARRRAMDVPNTGMVVTTDVGDLRDIHPTNKQEVGRRLALWALSETYGTDVTPSGPLVTGARAEADEVRVSFRHAQGLEPGPDDLEGFEIAGEDGAFVEAEARIDGDEVVVSSPRVRTPTAVRYGWSSTPEASLFNGAGLPASPFSIEVSGGE